jgi:D-cysteine desulfhydrase family pyridoxal phosphate-dependent enzyme
VTPHNDGVRPADLHAALHRLPRFPLATLPTPLHDAVRLRQALGGPEQCPRILIKRDDLTGFGLGGNKARKLEFLVADARQQRATLLVTTGAVQSNHARMTAAAAAVAGMSSVLVLTTRTLVPTAEGNLLLDRLFGARIRLVRAIDPMVAVGDDEVVVAEEMAAEKARGGRPYVIPVGGSSGIGALGYVAGTLELVEQLDAMSVQPSRLYYASGSRGTQAGLTLGARLCGQPYGLYGVAVSAGEPEKIERAQRAANEAATHLGVDARIERSELFTDQEFIGEGYGVPTPECLEAVHLLAQSEAIILDPTYTAKAMAALIQHVRTRALDARDTVVFLHTGGMPAIFAQDAALALMTRISMDDTDG